MLLGFQKIRLPWHRWCLLGASIWVLIGVVIPVTNHWAHPEFATAFLNTTYLTGNKANAEDLKSIFNYRGFESNYSRTRFVSYAMTIASIRLRAFLASIMPLHPSVSLNWIIVLLLIPLCTHAWLKTWTGRSDIADLGTALVFLSSGTLHGVTMLFHPAKSLAQLGIIVALYFLARGQKEKSQARAFRWIGLASTVLVITAYCDETGLWGFGLGLLLFLKWMARPVPLIIWGIGLFGFAWVILWGAPSLTYHAGFERVNILEFASAGHAISGLRLRLFLDYFELLMGSYILPFDSNRPQTDLRLWCSIAFGIGTLCWVFAKTKKTERPVGIVLAIGTLVYSLFHLLVMVRQDHAFRLEARSSFYYGGLITLTLSPLIAWGICNANGVRIARQIKWIGSIACMALFAWNNHQINAHWRGYHEKIWIDHFPSTHELCVPQGVLTGKNAMDLWSASRLQTVSSGEIAMPKVSNHLPFHALGLWRELLFARKADLSFVRGK